MARVDAAPDLQQDKLTVSVLAKYVFYLQEQLIAAKVPVASLRAAVREKRARAIFVFAILMIFIRIFFARVVSCALKISTPCVKSVMCCIDVRCRRARHPTCRDPRLAWYYSSLISIHTAFVTGMDVRLISFGLGQPNQPKMLSSAIKDATGRWRFCSAAHRDLTHRYRAALTDEPPALRHDLVYYTRPSSLLPPSECYYYYYYYYYYCYYYYFFLF
jgi:hypothetical protein